MKQQKPMHLTEDTAAAVIGKPTGLQCGERFNFDAGARLDAGLCIRSFGWGMT